MSVRRKDSVEKTLEEIYQTRQHFIEYLVITWKVPNTNQSSTLLISFSVCALFVSACPTQRGSNRTTFLTVESSFTGSETISHENTVIYISIKTILR